jgi:UDP-arabinose 4-epimerase
MLDCLLDRGLTNVIFSSSCATYGSPAMVPISESHAQTPVNPYGESKLVIEKALYWYGLSHGLSWVALRYFNAAGADPGGEVGESHDVETHLIPLAIRAALTPDFQFSLFGADYPTPDGTAIRDFIHVSDLASAHVLALKYLEDGKPSRAFNLGTGQGYSVSEIVANIEAITGRRVNLQVLPRRPGDPAELRADPRAAIEELHWTAKHSSVSEIISTAWQWAVRHATPEPETQVAPQIIPAGMSSAAGHLGLQPVS